MSERFSVWARCRYCMYQALFDRAVCVLDYEPCKREDCEMIKNE